MSILFPKVRMPRAYDYRPIYYDPKEDERKQKLARLQAKRRQEEAKKATEGDEEQTDQKKVEYVSTLHRGSFREAHDEHKSYRQKEQRKSRLIFWIALLGILFVVFYMWM